MKNRRALISALGLALFSVLLLAVYLSGIEKKLKGDYEGIEVLVATKDILRYEKIDDTMFAPRLIPKPYVQPLAVLKEEVNQVIGYRADSTIRKGEQILKTKLATSGEGGISPIIQTGYRACTVAVNEVSGVGGLVRPEDTVDIIGTFKTMDSARRVAGGVEAVTLFQNVPVLAVGSNYAYDRPMNASREKSVIPSSDRASGFSNVTLQVSQRECMDLAIAQQVGEITLALRSLNDRFGSKPNPEYKEKRSTTESVTGIRTPVEISKQPRWLELRGGQPLMVP